MEGKYEKMHLESLQDSRYWKQQARFLLGELRRIKSAETLDEAKKIASDAIVRR